MNGTQNDAVLKVHLRQGDTGLSYYTTACGWPWHDTVHHNAMTTTPAAVTCKSCQRTVLFKAAAVHDSEGTPEAAVTVQNGSEQMSDTCGHECEIGGVAYQCERPPHPIDDGSNTPAAPYRHAAVIDAGLAKGTEEVGEEIGERGTADLATWGEDELGGGQEWGIAWGDVTNFRDPEHGTYREHP